MYVHVRRRRLLLDVQQRRDVHDDLSAGQLQFVLPKRCHLHARLQGWGDLLAHVREQPDRGDVYRRGLHRRQDLPVKWRRVRAT